MRSCPHLGKTMSKSTDLTQIEFTPLVLPNNCFRKKKTKTTITLALRHVLNVEKWTLCYGSVCISKGRTISNINLPRTIPRKCSFKHRSHILKLLFPDCFFYCILLYAYAMSAGHLLLVFCLFICFFILSIFICFDCFVSLYFLLLASFREG